MTGDHARFRRSAFAGRRRKVAPSSAEACESAAQRGVRRWSMACRDRFADPYDATRAGPDEREAPPFARVRCSFGSRSPVFSRAGLGPNVTGRSSGRASRGRPGWSWRPPKDPFWSPSAWRGPAAAGDSAALITLRGGLGVLAVRIHMAEPGGPARIPPPLPAEGLSTGRPTRPRVPTRPSAGMVGWAIQRPPRPMTRVPNDRFHRRTLARLEEPKGMA